MKWLIIKDIDTANLKKGMIIDDERDKIYMTIELDRKFFIVNKKCFKVIEEEPTL